VQNGKCLVAWSRVQRPLALGGLGIPDLKCMGIALRLRWLWFQRSGSSKPWATMPTCEDCTAMAFFRASIQVSHGDGKSILFWMDPWLEGSHLIDRWPDLVAAVPSRHRLKRTLNSALTDGNWTSVLAGALTVPLILQYLDARHCIDQIQLHTGEPDKFVWKWTSSGRFSSKSAYEAMFFGESSILGVRELWKTHAPNKCRFYVWLAILDRLFKHGLRDDNVCALCYQGPNRWITYYLNVCSAVRCGSWRSVVWAGNS
jgi:hypothetical protein